MNDARYTCGFKYRIAMAKVAFNKKNALFASILDLNVRMKLVYSGAWGSVVVTGI
jgi:hypothetical protein